MSFIYNTIFFIDFVQTEDLLKTRKYIPILAIIPQILIIIIAIAQRNTDCFTHIIKNITQKIWHTGTMKGREGKR